MVCLSIQAQFRLNFSEPVVGVGAFALAAAGSGLGAVLSVQPDTSGPGPLLIEPIAFLLSWLCCVPDSLLVCFTALSLLQPNACSLTLASIHAR